MRKRFRRVKTRKIRRKKRKYVKSESRYTSEEVKLQYLEWKRAVLDRDQQKCMMPGCSCNSKSTLQAHHIIKWSADKSLRFVIDNGITLCKKSHKAITGNEELYEELFNIIVKLNKSDKTKTSKRTVINV